MIEVSDAGQVMFVGVSRNARNGVRRAVEHSLKVSGANPSKWGVFAATPSLKSTVVAIAPQHTRESKALLDQGFRPVPLPRGASLHDMVKAATKALIQ